MLSFRRFLLRIWAFLNIRINHEFGSGGLYVKNVPAFNKTSKTKIVVCNEVTKKNQLSWVGQLISDITLGYHFEVLVLSRLKT